ncbi:28S ribosomal protein S25, mitochondrial [Alligator sinensis]|uniref:28S ribosomal protein S25, mitochondrial n=1 Tax=Alligator sinensis TaxID=38654 RepID=A0A3Q0GLF5_ALLSI|nr:28S ribosomal protein S25, mitochondrial [Alligator sinensis]
MPMKGRFPIRRTMEYLRQGDLEFKSAVRIMMVNYNTQGSLSEGARCCKRPIERNGLLCKVLLRSPIALACSSMYSYDGKQVLVDIEEKTNKEITERIKKIFGKSRETLEREEQAKKEVLHPATFGPKKYHLRECMCEIEGQVPCPGKVPLPKEMTGKYKAAMKAAAASE